MNYIGSKNRLSSFLLDTIQQTVGQDLSQVVFCDLFAGTGIVGRTFKPLVKKVISNDLEYYSYIVNRYYIGVNAPCEQAETLLQELNRLDGVHGLITEYYSEKGAAARNYYSIENAQKIDAIRQQIERWRENNTIDASGYYLLLTSLIEAADKIANTASVYGAFLKHLKKSAQNKIVLTLPEFIIKGQNNEVYNEDGNELIKRIQGDVLYLDPPYNQRQYGANYHVLTTLAKYDEFIPQGVTGLRDYNKSAYCSKSSVVKVFEELIQHAQFNYIFLSYNNEGLMSPSVIQSILEKYGEYSLATTAYQRFKADKTESRNHKADATVEFLHILKKEI
jgi:adenine-specific DNA-methyltransferase